MSPQCDNCGEHVLKPFKRAYYDNVVEADADGFWDAVREAYEQDEAVENLRKLFTATETARRFEDGIVMEIEVPVRSKNYTYTDESLRAFEVAEEKAREKVEKEAEEAYSA